MIRASKNLLVLLLVYDGEILSWSKVVSVLWSTAWRSSLDTQWCFSWEGTWFTLGPEMFSGPAGAWRLWQSWYRWKLEVLPVWSDLCSLALSCAWVVAQTIWSLRWLSLVCREWVNCLYDGLDTSEKLLSDFLALIKRKKQTCTAKCHWKKANFCGTVNAK